MEKIKWVKEGRNYLYTSDKGYRLRYSGYGPTDNIWEVLLNGVSILPPSFGYSRVIKGVRAAKAFAADHAKAANPLKVIKPSVPSIRCTDCGATQKL